MLRCEKEEINENDKTFEITKLVNLVKLFETLDKKDFKWNALFLEMYKSFEAYIKFKDGVGVGVGNYLEEFLRFLFRASIISNTANYIELLNFKSNEINLM